MTHFLRHIIRYSQFVNLPLFQTTLSLLTFGQRLKTNPTTETTQTHWKVCKLPTNNRTLHMYGTKTLMILIKDPKKDQKRFQQKQLRIVVLGTLNHSCNSMGEDLSHYQTQKRIESSYSTYSKFKKEKKKSQGIQREYNVCICACEQNLWAFYWIGNQIF